MTYEILEYLNYAYIRDESPRHYFERGEGYYECGHVKNFIIEHTEIIAEVRGSRTYKTRIWVDQDDRVDYSCTCPLGDNNEFCKHLVATALTAINIEKKSQPPEDTKPASLDDIKRYLNSKKKAELIDLVAELVKSDYKLRDKLGLEASLCSGKKINIGYYKKKIDSIFSSYYNEDNYYDDHYYDDEDSSDELTRELFKALKAMFAGGSVSEVKELCEYFFTEHNRLGYCGDDAYFTAESLLEEHKKSCVILKTEAAELAETLFELEVDDVSGGICGLDELYSSLLGDTGKQVFKSLALEMWNVNRGKRNIKSMMERLADTLDDWITIRSVYLKDEADYCVIAERCLLEKKYDKAFEWMQKAQKDIKTKPSERLITLLMDEYKRRKNYSEMMKLAWPLFVQYVNFHTYSKLEDYANAEGTWKSKWRAKALALSLDKAEKNFKPNNRWLGGSGDLLISIALYENNIETAWQYYDRFSCNNGTLLHLADNSTKTYPERASEVYKKNIAGVLQKADMKNYESAVKLMKKLRKVMKQTEFKNYCQQIRENNKRRPNMITLLNRNKL